MLYTKPKDITYTEMAISIDEMAYSDNFDENLVFEYLYHLAYMLAVKGKFFNNSTDYNNFSIFTATRAFNRITSKKQFVLDANGSPKQSKIKSSLNYLKAILYPCKVSYQQENYVQTDISIDDPAVVSDFSFSSALSDYANSIMKIEFRSCIDDVSNSIRSYLKHIPYTSAEWNNIYVSCLLSVLNSITLSSVEKKHIQSLKKENLNDSALNYYYDKQKEDFVILFHLGIEMHDYIYVLVKNILNILGKELSEALNTDVDYSDINPILIKKEINSVYDYDEVI